MPARAPFEIGGTRVQPGTRATVELPISVLRRLYRLTPAEAHLANALFQGKSFAQAAEARGISLNTAKYTLKSIFSKCEVSSRSELLLLLSLGPRTL